MKTKTWLSAAIWAGLGLSAMNAQVVVVNRNVKVTEISKADLRDIFTGASSNFKDGSHAIPATLKSGPAQDVFLKVYIGKNDAAFRATWRGMVFAGQGTMPKAFDTEAALIEYVASVPGAVGYIGAATEHDKVNALTVK